MNSKMKTVVALEDLKFNVVYRMEGKKAPCLKKLSILKGSIFSLGINKDPNAPKYIVKGAVGEVLYKTNDLNGKFMEVNLIHRL